MNDLTSIIIFVFFALLLGFIFWGAFQKEKQSNRNGIDLDNVTKNTSRGFESFVQTFIRSNAPNFVLFIDGCLVFATAVLTQDSFVHAKEYQLSVAVIANVIPFTIAIIFSLKHMLSRALPRFENMYLKYNSKDYVYNRNAGVGKLWTIAMSDIQSRPRRVLEEFIENKKHECGKRWLTTLIGFWAFMQTFIFVQINVNVYNNNNDVFILSEHLTPSLILILTIILDIVYVRTTSNIGNTIDTLHDDYLYKLSRQKDFKSIEDFIKDNGYDVNKYSFDLPKDLIEESDAVVEPITTSKKEEVVQVEEVKEQTSSRKRGFGKKRGRN